MSERRLCCTLRYLAGFPQIWSKPSTSLPISVKGPKLMEFNKKKSTCGLGRRKWLLFSKFIDFVIYNRRFSSSVQENLRRGEGDIADLISINIQRSRERGVSGYTKYRNLPLCGLRKVRSFDDLVRNAGFDPSDVANLKRIYRNVHDIDFFTGGELVISFHILFTFNYTFCAKFKKKHSDYFPLVVRG